MNLLKNRKTVLVGVVLAAILVLAVGLRFYKLGEVPKGFSWDEAAVGYNAWTILRFGQDEWGKPYPLAFQSFGDYKNPVHIYLTAPFVSIFGMNEFGVRSAVATFGVLNVLLLYLVTRELVEDERLALLAAFFLAVSPFNLQFSKFHHELNFTIFFFLLSTWLFFLGIKKHRNLLPLAFLFFGVDLITYHSAKVMVPLMVGLMIAVNFKKLWSVKKYFLVSLLVLIGFVTLVFGMEPNLLGLARLGQTSSTAQAAGVWSKVQVIGEKYVGYFSYKFLFGTGDEIPRHSSQLVGTFWRIDALLLPVGVVAMALKAVKKKWNNLLVLGWLFLAPLPATVGVESAHAARAMFLTGSGQIVAAVGLLTLMGLVKSKYWRLGVMALALGVLAQQFVPYWKDYYTKYADQYAIEFQYGMKDVVNYTKDHPEYIRVYMTDAFSQPYIFFLFYDQVPLPYFLSTVQYNETRSRPSNLVASFGRYKFGLWDERESVPTGGILYVVNPSHYDGLRRKDRFEVAKLVSYPNKTDAFYIITAKNEKQD